MIDKLFLLSNEKYEALSTGLQKDIYQEYYQFVYSAIIFMVKNHATTEDIIQTSFLKVIEKIPPGLSNVQLKSWIKVVVRNSVHNYFRKTKKTATTSTLIVFILMRAPITLLNQHLLNEKLNSRL